MKNRKFILFAFAVISLLVFSGCAEIPDEPSQDEVSDRVQTNVAQTQQAKNLIETIVAQTMAVIDIEKATQEQATPTATLTLVPTETPTQTNTPTITPSMTPTQTASATSSVTFVEVSVPTNCRTGPGKIYDRVSILDVDEKVEVVARNAEGTYWVVKNPGGSGVCWLWDEYAKVTGQTANLPVWVPPPTPTPQAKVTSTPTGVTLKVTVPTNCRVGPGKPYDIISVLRPGKTAKVHARDASADFWVIDNPEGSGTCWVWGNYAVISGSTKNLPVCAPPPTPTPQPSKTSTPTVVTLKVTVPTNCRVGPGKFYDIVSVMRPGKTARVHARDASADFWVIDNPEGSGTCWVWGNYAILTGSTSDLPVWAPPPTPTPSK